MRNLKPYKDESFKFYEEVVASKKNSKEDKNYKERIHSQRIIISNQFKQYDEKFNNDTLTSLHSHRFSTCSKSDLIKLYSYKNKLIQKLKIVVTTTEKNRILNTCQNCTISEVNSFDHFVNKDEFPEYAVHPKNLFPSCTKCNSYKGDEWRHHGKTKYLNLYLDPLPKQQYLFVDIIVDAEVTTTKFYLDNPYGINHQLFERIQSHYEKLHLCERFQENVDSIITELENLIFVYKRSLTRDKITELVLESSEKNMGYFGNNFWKSILEMKLAKNKTFLDKAFEM